jgi:pimeloyl-ACP methyl ester carboxylesterase
MHDLRGVALLIVGGTWLGLSGCGIVPYETTLQDPSVRKPTQQQAQRGLVWLFPGLIGVPWELGPAYRGLCAAGLDEEVQFFQWDIPAPDFFAHLTRYDANRKLAADVADQVAGYRQSFPEQRIDLVGYSAGGFMVVQVLEALPADVHVHNVVLVEPAISPGYDLTAALAHVDGELVNFYCDQDWLHSGLFTLVFGTMDRKNSVTAGLIGLDLSQAAPDPELAAKVHQIAWSTIMIPYGHTGDHTCILKARWNEYFVSPYVVEPDELSIDPPLGPVGD